MVCDGKSVILKRRATKTGGPGNPEIAAQWVPWAKAGLKSMGAGPFKGDDVEGQGKLQAT